MVGQKLGLFSLKTRADCRELGWPEKIWGTSGNPVFFQVTIKTDSKGLGENRVYRDGCLWALSRQSPGRHRLPVNEYAV